MEEDGTLIRYLGMKATSVRCYYGITVREIDNNSAELFVTDCTHNKIYVFSTKSDQFIREYDNIYFAYGIMYYTPLNALYVTSNSQRCCQPYDNPPLYILNASDGSHIKKLLRAQNANNRMTYSGIDIFDSRV